MSLVCTVIAHPYPVISWKRLDPEGKSALILKPIAENERTAVRFDGNYPIYNAGLEDSGTYLCNASNTLGYESYVTKITIKPGTNLDCFFRLTLF